MTVSSEPMSGVDLAWLRMERRTNPMMIVAVLTLRTPLPYAALCATIEERLLRFLRFRCRPVLDITGAHWESDPYFALESHVLKLTLPARATQRHLEAAASELASTPLDPRRPMWQIHLIERYRRGSAVIARFHHCYADGIAMMRILSTLTDASSEARKPPKPEGTPEGQLNGWLGLAPLADSVLSLARNAAQSGFDLASTALHVIAHPLEAANAAMQIASVSTELARIATLSEEPKTPLKRELGTQKHVAWAKPLPFAEVKAVGEALGCTINDVLLATVAGALGSYLRHCGTELDRVSLRALVPVNLRDPGADAQLGNHFGLVFANLPVGESDPLVRLRTVHKDMESLKHSPQPVLALWLLMAMGVLPAAVEAQAIELFTKKASVVISDVPGPRKPLYLAGARIDEQYFWVPQAGSIGVGISLLTYDGKVHFGVMTDDNLIAAPRRLADLFAVELEKLLLCAIATRSPRDVRPMRRTRAPKASPAKHTRPHGRSRTSR